MTDVVKTEPLAPPTLVQEGSATDDSQIEVVWDPLTGQDAGFDAITEYIVYWDNGSTGTNWLELVAQEDGAFTYSYVHSLGITRGNEYQFRYRGVNIHGQGADSQASTIKASKEPQAPLAPALTVSSTDVIVTWLESPDDHGSAVTDYRVEFKQVDDVFSQVAECQPIASSLEFSSRSCTIPMSTFRDSPFSLPIGSLIVGVVTAINEKGDSARSTENGSGATVQGAPSASPALSRGDQTNESQIELTWVPISEMEDIGNSAITGHKIYWDSGDGLGNYNLFDDITDPA